ncbi:site-specific integrase [Polynucleobacter sp. UK-Kesae-W10]|uniref:tyrosine-type recombinase/integrase n=1 Tax=Polynucleobacter sp. UK-Kesae-W10 TaxID=1819738 RepID=UPI001C0BD85A|nr:site-specific integrase [Polynucleobacter sp. UK-Kesae-W10]MBU3577485.1 tyrosine-type recombinase/integrase [Polynucleobacter sp. UK-Kesae-W10]
MAIEVLTDKVLKQKVKEAAQKAAAKNTRVKVHDGNNLVLTVRQNGGASWQFIYRFNNDRKVATLGVWPDVTLKHARTLASELRALVSTGKDPVQKKREELKEKSKAKAESEHNDMTVRKLFLVWLSKKRISQVYHSNILKAFTKDVLPEIGAMHPAQVQRKDILKILRNMEERKALAMLRKVRMFMAQMYEYALDAEMVEHSPVPMGQLASFMKHEKKHYPAITNHADVAGLIKQVVKYGKPIVRTAIILSMHTFQRPSELRKSKWEEFDLKKAKWTIPAERTKKRREHWVPLSPQVVAILKAYQGVIGDTGWLFPGTRHDQPISEGTIAGAIEEMGYKGIQTPHGFRATARTIMCEHLRISKDAAEKQIAHEFDRSGNNGAYDRAEYWDDRVAMMAKWSSWLEEQDNKPDTPSETASAQSSL